VNPARKVHARRAGGTLTVELHRGAAVFIDAGPGAQVALTRGASGAVELVNVVTGKLLRQWSPKEASSP
jgi:hypothetical protein